MAVSNAKRPNLGTMVQPKTGKRIPYYKSSFKNLYDTLSASAERYPNKIAAIDDRVLTTYGELKEKVDSLAARLYWEYQVRSGKPVAMLMVNSVDFCVVFYALAKLGCMIVLLNTKMQSEQLQFFLQDTAAEMIFSDGEWLRKLRPILKTTSIQTVVSTDESDGSVSLAALCRREGLDDVNPTRDVHLPLVVMYTSGTTGTPKGAVISHFNILQCVLSYADMLDVDERDCTVISVPMFHITGLCCLMNLFVYLGGKMILVPKFDAEKVNRLMMRYQATHLHAVPSIFTLLLNAQAADIQLCLKTAVCGGGYISQEQIRRYIARNPGVSFHRAYGMTETAGGGVLSPRIDPDGEKADATGLIVPNTEMVILDKEMKRVGTGEVGQVCISGASVIGRYWNHGENEGFFDGYLLSGDLGKIDGDGYIYIVDRIKDMINRSGEKVFSLVVENVALKMPEINQIAVFPVSDAVHGEVGAAIVVPNAGSGLTAQQVADFLGERLAKYEVPKYIEISNNIPVNANNKISKSELRRNFERRILPGKENGK